MQFLLVDRLYDGMTRSEYYFYYSLPFIVVFVALFFAVRKQKKRDSKNYSNDFISASVVFGCLLIFREDNRSVGQKLSWIDRYLKKRFANSDFDVIQIYQDVVQMGVDLPEYTALANEKLSTRQRIHLMEFLILLGNTNGGINPRESEFIFYLLKRFKLSLDDLDRAIQDILIPKSDASSVFVKNLSYYFGVLDIDENSDLSEIKGAYRKLVKIYHPDNNQNLNETEKKERVTRFLEIQQAYEVLIAR